MDFKITLERIIDQLSVFQAEAALLVGAMLLLLLVNARFSQVVLRLFVSSIILIAIYLTKDTPGDYFNGWVEIDPIAHKMKRLLLVSTLLITWFIRRPYQRIEFYFFLLSGLTGALVMLVGQHFLLIYLGIELASFSSYFLTGMRMTPKSSEATLKYVLFGGVTSAVMLYGLSLIYGATGSLALSELAEHPFVAFGMLMFFAGLLFKASLVPFHLWVPSTYQEAPSDAAVFFAIVPKISAFVLIYHVVDKLPVAYEPIAIKTLLAVALVTVLWGTISALPQIRLKRTIAFGAIAHSGFLLPLVLLGSQGITAFSYYATIYALMNLGVFYLIHFHEKEQVRSLKFTAFNGFGSAAPVFAAAMVILLVALVGLPPTAGFTAKLLLFSNVYQQYTNSGEQIWIVYLVVGVLSTILSLYYYLKLPVSYFLRKSEKIFETPTPVQVAAATILSLLMLWVFMQPEILNSFVL